MARFSTAPRHIGLMGLAVAGALAGSAGSAAAQYYDDDYYDAPSPYYGNAYRYGYGYGYGPRVVEPVTPRDIRRIAAQDYGLVRIDRLARAESAYVIDGMQANGQRQRLILDAFAGNLIRRLSLGGVPPGPPPTVARIDPREEREPPRPRLVPRPPERPAELRPPAEANAPATAIPPSPAAPPAPERAPALPAPPQPPAEASAPATQTPPPVAAPAAPSPGPADPQSGVEKPRLVNPEDVRGTDAAERKPPLATPAPSAEAAVPLAPVQGQDTAPAQPKPDTQIAPVAPLE